MVTALAQRTMDIRVATDATVAALREAGLIAAPYARGPLGPEIFNLGMDQNSEIIRVWNGTASARVTAKRTGSKPQVVLRVTESAHANEHTITLHRNPNATQPPEMSSAELRSHITTNYPTGTTFRIKSHKAVEGPDPYWRSGRKILRWSCVVEASVPAFDISFLIGYDEEKCFVCQLPGHATSITAAHNSLRPDTVPAGSPRHGEWFFVPVSDDKLWNALTDYVNDHLGYHIKEHVINGNVELESGSTHRSSMVTYNGRKYAFGTVKDTRNKRHANIELEGWHEVVRNLEVIVTPAQSQTQRRQNWD